MLVCQTESEWNTAFTEASNLISGHPLKLDLLQKNHLDPKYCAGYVTRKIVGNLEKDKNMICTLYSYIDRNKYRKYDKIKKNSKRDENLYSCHLYLIKLLFKV